MEFTNIIAPVILVLLSNKLNTPTNTMIMVKNKNKNPM